MAISKLILNGEVQMDVTSDTVTAGTMMSGITATKNDGTKTTGTIASKSSSDLTVSGATVTAPAGYYANAASKAVATTTHPNPSASITSSTGVVTASHTQAAGYVTSGTTTGTLNLTTQAATTYNTSTADQTIASNRWLTGAQTIKGVTTSNLTAANIAEGVVVKVGDANNASRITQVTGTHRGATSHTATIVSTGLVNQDYVLYNNTKYYTEGDTFSFNEGDTITLYAQGTYSAQIWIGQEIIQYTETSDALTYSLIAPGGTNITISLDTDPGNGMVGVDYNDFSTYVGSDIPEANWTFSKATGVFSTSSGYMFESMTYPLTTQAAQTIYPSTADQTIASQRWLTGAQTIKGVTTSNLTAANIASGVTVKVGDTSNASRITQITGTYSGANNYTCTILSSSGHNLTNIKYNNVTYTYSSGSFNFVPGTSCQLNAERYPTGIDTRIVINGSTVSSADAAITYSYIFPSYNITATLFNGVIQIAEPVIPSATLNISSNGTYNVYGYSSADVNVGGGFTVDQIAMRTISGDISGSATTIGSYAFYYCSALTTASFPSATRISMYAFAFCSSLTTASFPSATSIGGYAFNSCSALTTASFPNVTSVGNYAFWYCSALTTASFPKATYIGMNAFNYCTKLTTASFPSATIISSGAFASCFSLTTANFPNVTSIGASAFNYCYLLTTVSFPSATIIGSSAFISCYSLTTVSFSNVTSIGSNAFYSCSALTTASFPNVTSIGNFAFRSCFNLLSFYLLGSSIPTLGASVFYSTPIGGYSISADQFGSVYVPASLYSSYLTATNWSAYADRIVSV